MEEIDIIELLKRVKEGKAPKKIEIEGRQYSLTGHSLIKYKYNDNGIFWFSNDNIYLDTKIKILDKPIIEELDERYMNLPEVYQKINEIIEVLNGRNI